ncbi:MAG: hypothetical protein J6328_02270 [Bacilli bacterium]|nr:hypothetical protein [Bacilli bacterium]
MASRRCKYCGSEVGIDDTISPFCGASLPRGGFEEPGKPKQSFRPAEGSYRGKTSSDWIRKRKLKAFFSLAVFTLLLYCLIFLPVISPMTELWELSHREVCHYDYYTRQNVCEVQSDGFFETFGLVFVIFVLLIIFTVALSVFITRPRVRRIGGSDVMLYSGLWSIQLIIDGVVVDSVTSRRWWKGGNLLKGITADGKRILVSPVFNRLRKDFTYYDADDISSPK